MSQFKIKKPWRVDKVARRGNFVIEVYLELVKYASSLNNLVITPSVSTLATKCNTDISHVEDALSVLVSANWIDGLCNKNTNNHIQIYLPPIIPKFTEAAKLAWPELYQLVTPTPEDLEVMERSKQAENSIPEASGEVSHANGIKVPSNPQTPPQAL